jgi:hypothetical protein
MKKQTKKKDEIKEESPVSDRLDDIVRHINNVSDNCMLLGKRLIAIGMVDLGRLLIANGFIHDNSKFYGVEWDYLNDTTGDSDLLKIAISQHNRTNPHHPEYWGNIELMPKIYVAEMVCDWKARATEFGTSLQDWIDVGAAEKFGYKKDSEIYRRIVYYAQMLCDKPFKEAE